MNGQVPYKDLFEQKGPYLFLIYGISYLIKNDSFTGVFILEIVSFSIFLYFCYKILNLYCKQRTAFLLLPLLSASILSSQSFYWGGSAEEFCLPFLGSSLYYSSDYFKKQYPEAPSLKIILLNGIFAGIIMQIKYTMLGFHFAWMAMIAFSCLAHKDWRSFFKGCLTFLSGMLLTMLPWLIYFGINGALYDWYDCYIYTNIFLYSDLGEEGVGFINKIIALAKILYWLILDNFSYFLFIIAGIISLLLSLKERWYEKVNLLLLSAFLFLGIYVGGAVLPYYSLPLSIFTVLGFAVIGRLFDYLVLMLPHSASPRPLFVFLLLSTIIMSGSLNYAYSASMNSDAMKQDKSSHFLYKFKDIVQAEDNPTLLNISCLDAGLYTVADILPTCRYFQLSGIPGCDEAAEQEQYIKDAKTQFVLARDTYPEIILKNYDLVSQAPYYQDGLEFTYYLFKRKE
ncbi:MAG: glycosyltransferase family 39 protein [Clostridiales bacterium]|nr:glycosyltransferase family 39 protein [Clostridiales bacterium]